MTFDPTITLGALLIVLGHVASMFWFAARVDKRIDLLGLRLAAVEDNLRNSRDVSERLAVIETLQATHGQLIANLQTDQQDLRRGRGFIKDRGPDGGINGEWP